MTTHEGDNLPEKQPAAGELEAADPIADPGLPAHTWRPTDVDPKAEKRAERQVATLFGLSAVCTVLFVVSYFTLEIGEVTTTIWANFQGADPNTPASDDRPTKRHGFDAWLEYAGTQGIDVPDDVIDAKDRDAVIALVEAAAEAAKGDPGAGDGPDA